MPLTAQQKKSSDRIAKMIGNLSHPKARRMARNIISMGTVTRSKVIMTSFFGGSCLCTWVECFAAWSAVDSRETTMDPTLPGSPIVFQGGNLSRRLMNAPLITMASKGNPRYLDAKVSRIIPVALLITMAPNRGGQPCHMRSLTSLLRLTKKVHQIADKTRNNTSTSGNGVLTKLIKAEETVPSKDSVTKSPRHDATGGAILSTRTW